MKQVYRLVLQCTLLFIANSMYAQGSGQPNIIFIFSDDLMTITDAIGGGSQIIAPNIQRLADRGVTFTRACANSTVCGPSRASVFTGVLPSTSGHFGYRMGTNSWENNPVLGQTSTMFAHMKSNGYRVYGLGKIFHRSADNASDFNVLNTNNSGPIIISATSTPDEEEEVTSLPGFPNNLDATHFGSSISLSELENYPGYSWAYKSGAPFNYVSETDRSLMGDELITQQAVVVLNEAHENPFFLTLGYRSPHTPQYAPDTFYELYNFGSLELATLIHESPWSQPIALEKNRWNSSGGYSDFRAAEALSQDFAVSEYWLRKAVHGYYALVSFLDHQIGIILDELDASPYANNTLIILSSDHGYHLGDKLRIKKTTLWNQASLVPLIIAGPGVSQGVTCNKPVSLIDIYPTLVDAAAIQNPSSHNLDGSSLFPLLQDPEGSWNGSPYAISAVACDELIGDNISATAHHQHYSLISEHMRYIYYSSGEEELYSYIDDPREINNLIYSPKYQIELNDFRNYLSILLDGKIRFSNVYQNLFYGDFWQKLNGWNRSGSSLATVVAIENSVSPEFPHFATINSPNANYNIVNKNVKLEKDHSYELCFHAKKTTMNGNISVRIVRDVAEDQSVLQSFSVSPTDNWVKYCFEYTEQNDEDPFTRMLQISGTVPGSFDVDKFSIEDIAKRTALECPQTNALTLNPANTQQASAQEIVLSYTPKYTESPCGINAMPSVTLQKWFRFNAPAEEVNIWAQGNDEFRGGIELFQTCNSPLLACTEGGAPGQKSVLVAKELIPGNEYFVRIYHNALTYVSDTVITGGVLFVPVTTVPPSKCKPVNIAEPLTLQLSGIPSYLNLDSWQLEVTNLTNAGEPVYTSLPPTIPPVFLFNNPEIFFQANKTYRIRARARMYEGPIWGEFGEPCIFNTVNQAPTSQSILTEISHSDEQEILIFPNPLSDGPFTVLIGSELEKIKSVEVFDQLGRLITVETLVQPGEIKVNPKTSIASGLYFVTVITEMGRRTTLPLFVTGLN